MPNTYGHAISFYNNSIRSGGINIDRNLVQIKNTEGNYPKIGDIIVIDYSNKYGHVAIVKEVKEKSVVVVQQNCRLKEEERVK